VAASSQPCEAPLGDVFGDVHIPTAPVSITSASKGTEHGLKLRPESGGAAGNLLHPDGSMGEVAVQMGGGALTTVS